MEGFEPAIPASERPQAHALDRAVNGIGVIKYIIFSSSEYFNISHGK